MPCITIVNNSGYIGNIPFIIGTSIAEYIYQNDNMRIGFDGYMCEMKDLVSEGIVDAAKVIRVSLINAVSVATMLLTTESVLAFERDPPVN